MNRHLLGFVTRYRTNQEKNTKSLNFEFFQIVQINFSKVQVFEHPHGYASGLPLFIPPRVIYASKHTTPK